MKLILNTQCFHGGFLHVSMQSDEDFPKLQARQIEILCHVTLFSTSGTLGSSSGRQMSTHF